MDNFRRTMSVDDEIDYSKLYFTIETLEDDNIISINYSYNGAGGVPTNGYYSTDGVNWIAYEMYQTRKLSITLNNIGDKVYIKTISTKWRNDITGGHVDRVYFSSTKLCNIYGNILSLVYSDDFVNQTELRTRLSLRLIFDSLKVVDASNLIMPNHTVVGCYYGMFTGRNELVKAPKLPATTLSDNCYYRMFYGCTNLVDAPELPATTLVYSCYYQMFYGCTSLNYIKCLATLTNTSYTNSWLQNVSDTGTFVKSADADNWPRSASGIPAGWTVIDA